nr:RNA-directed DNA polymerase, eukaryota, reverse transcriptase zinc-binding domain protein [Tanacetum cinerariifolium]
MLCAYDRYVNDMRFVELFCGSYVVVSEVLLRALVDLKASCMDQSSERLAFVILFDLEHFGICYLETSFIPCPHFFHSEHRANHFKIRERFSMNNSTVDINILSRQPLKRDIHHILIVHLTYVQPDGNKDVKIGNRHKLVREWDHGRRRRTSHDVESGVLRKLESLRSHFFNGCALNNQKASWVNWKNALASKEKGGLGIASLYALNRGLMFKWYWRFFTKDSSLWSRVIKAIYGDSGGLDGNIFANYNSCWSNIVKEVTSLDEKGLNLCNAICFKLGNGKKARFWEDRWLDDNQEGGWNKNNSWLFCRWSKTFS